MYFMTTVYSKVEYGFVHKKKVEYGLNRVIRGSFATTQHKNILVLLRDGLHGMVHILGRACPTHHKNGT
jgi:hypothetical protein